MKKTFILTIACFTLMTSYSQIEFGIKTGLSSLDLASEGIFIKDDINSTYKLNFVDSEYGFHFGLYSRLSILGFYIEPAAIINSTTINYSLDELWEGGVLSTIKNEHFSTLDIPLLVGMRLGILRVQAGPVAHIILDSSSELFDISGYNQRFKDANYGFQAGFGLDIFKLRFDILYEGNLSKFGEHINIGDVNYTFDDRPSRLIGHIAYKF